MPTRQSNVPRKVKATGHAEPGRPEVWLEPGRLYVPPTIQAVVEPEDWPGGARLEIWFTVDDNGRPSCSEVKIRAGNGDTIGGELLKRITLSRIMAAGIVDAAWRHDPDTTQVGAADPVEMQERYPESVKRSGRGKRKTDEFLKRIVKLYRHALAEGEAPTRVIAHEEMVNRTTARRWLHEAVKRGLLEESERLGPSDGGRLRANGQNPGDSAQTQPSHA